MDIDGTPQETGSEEPAVAAPAMTSPVVPQMPAAAPAAAPPPPSAPVSEGAPANLESQAAAAAAAPAEPVAAPAPPAVVSLPSGSPPLLTVPVAPSSTSAAAGLQPAAAPAQVAPVPRRKHSTDAAAAQPWVALRENVLLAPPPYLCSPLLLPYPAEAPALHNTPLAPAGLTGAALSLLVAFVRLCVRVRARACTFMCLCARRPGARRPRREQKSRGARASSRWRTPSSTSTRWGAAPAAPAIEIPPLPSSDPSAHHAPLVPRYITLHARRPLLKPLPLSTPLPRPPARLPRARSRPSSRKTRRCTTSSWTS